MSTTPIWLPLASAGIAVLGTLGGVVFTQRSADHRDNKTWQRQREVEHERWSREDVARTFEHRREAYADFYESLMALARRAYNHGYGFDDTPELPWDWHSETFAKLSHMKIYADRKTFAAASAAYGAAWSWGQNTKYDDPEDPEFYERQERYDQVEHELLTAIREALAIPEGDPTLPLPGYSHEASSPVGESDQSAGSDSG